MELRFIPSLQHASLVTIASSLWNNGEINDLLKAHLEELISDDTDSYHAIIKERKKIIDAIIQNISRLKLPEKLKKLLSNIIPTLEEQILEWMKFQFNVLNLPKILPSKFIWRTNGVLDMGQIAEVLIRDSDINAYDSYKLSCIYCLENCINSSWAKLQKSKDKLKLNNRETDEYIAAMLDYWSNQRKKNSLVEKLKSLVKTEPIEAPISELKSSILCGNEAAVRYFMKKLSADEKYRFLSEVVTYELCKFFLNKVPFYDENLQYRNTIRHAHILIFLLSEMCQDQKMTLSNDHRQYWVLSAFLFWPYQTLLLENARLSWIWSGEYKNEHDYDLLLLRCADRIIKGYQDYDYVELFKNIWRETPWDVKKDAVDMFLQSWGRPILLDFFTFVKENDIELIVEERNLFYEEVINFDIRYFETKNYVRDKFCWHPNEIGIFQIFLCGSIFPEDVMIKYIKDYKDRITRQFELDGKEVEEKIVWFEYLNVLDEFFRTGDESLKDTRIRYKVKRYGKFLQWQEKIHHRYLYLRAQRAMIVPRLYDFF